VLGNGVGKINFGGVERKQENRPSKGRSQFRGVSRRSRSRIGDENGILLNHPHVKSWGRHA